MKLYLKVQYIFILFHALANVLYIFLYVYLTNRFHFPVVCSVIDAQMTSQRGKNKKVGHVMLLPCCDVICTSITEQTTEKWNLFVLYNTYMKKYIAKDLLNFRALKKMNRVNRVS